ncbi:MAG: signal peptidase I, partial [Aggregatilineales bacterium]
NSAKAQLYPSLPRPVLKSSGWMTELVSRLLFIIVVYILINLLSVRFVVDGPSMRPGFETGQFLLVSRLDYLLGNPARGDVAVFHFPDDPTQDYIKRVLGLPGETLEIRAGMLYINGRLFDEPYLYAQCELPGCADGIWQLGADEYFMMGDNRQQSSDSRAFGAIERQHMVGRVILRYWSPADAGRIYSYQYQDEK